MLTTKERANNYLKIVDGPICFYGCDGRVLRGLRDLLNFLQTTSDDSFCYHSNEHKSDFHRWIKDVFGDVRLAESFWKYRKKRSKLFQVLHDHLDDLERAARGKMF